VHPVVAGEMLRLHLLLLGAAPQQPNHTEHPLEMVRKPLTDEQITEICCTLEQQGNTMRQFARVIEAAHGIKDNT
jgi:hypothetical protein